MTKNKEIEDIIVDQIYSEYTTGEENNEQDNIDFEQALDMFDNVRTERDYDWQSDIPLPEFLNAQQGQSADDASAYFARKEYVNVNVLSKAQEDIDSADAAKDMIDKTLGASYLDYFQKYMRLTQTKNICGRAYVRCWWEQDIKATKIPVKELTVLEEIDINGQPKINPEQQSATVEVNKEQEFNEVIRDRFNFDVIDPRNIVYSGEYEYNLRNKNWIILRYETTYHELKRNAKIMGYMNLDKIKGVKLSGETEVKEKVTDMDLHGSPKRDNDITPVKNLQILERWGMDYAMVSMRDENGNATGEIGYGYDEEGEIKEGAELVHLVQNIAILNGESSDKILIRYELNPYKDNFGNRYIPLARGLCYIHPTKDRGFGDDVGARGLQKAINDTFNANNDNTLLGMLKIIKQPEGYDEDEMPLRIAPMEVWPANTEVVDFPSNTVPSLNQLEMLKATFNETQARDSGVPVMSSAAATTVARAEKQVNVRSQYKKLVFEYTMLGNLYWMIIMMSSQFMLAETAIDMLGEELALAFNSDLDYHYKPISESIETDATSGAKIDRLNTALGYVMNSQNAKTPAVANGILKRIFKLMGKEEEEITSELFDEDSPMQPPPAGGGGQPAPSPGSPVQSAVNQSGMAQPSQQQNQGAIQ